MTVDELNDLTKRLSAEGKGGCTVLLSSDAEGNSFRPLDPSYLTGLWRPLTGAVTAGILHDSAKPNAVAFFPI